LKTGDVLTPLFLNFAVECTIRKAEAKEKDLKVNIFYQVLVCGDGVKTFSGSTYTIHKNTEDGSC
jgi:hypothetical protein